MIGTAASGIVTRGKSRITDIYINTHNREEKDSLSDKEIRSPFRIRGPGASAPDYAHTYTH